MVRARGELDSGSSEELLEALRKVYDDHGRLTLDLREISFIDSAGMRTMIIVEQEAGEAGVELEVLSPPNDVVALLRTAGLTDKIKLTPSSPGAWDEEFSERIELEFPRNPRSPSRARAEVREALAGQLTEDELGQVVLLTSELMTNAVIHPGQAGEGAIGLRLTTFGHCVRIEVEDPGEGFDPTAPIATPPTEDAPQGGRGLFLVDTCSTRWGAERVETEKGPRFRVWFEFEWTGEGPEGESAD